MATRVIKLNLEGVKLDPKMRYMTNITLNGPKGCPVFPYSQERMDRNTDLREVYPIVKTADARVDEPEFSLEEPVEIEQPVIEVPAPVAEQKAAPDSEKTEAPALQKLWRDMSVEERKAYQAAKKQAQE